MGIAARALILVAAFTSPVFAQDNGWIQDHLAYLDGLFGATVEVLAFVLFADFGTGFPLIVAILVAGGLYYTFYFRWMSVRAFKHAIDVVRGRFDNPEDPGEISHFQALSSALSATIGLGNIAGVAIAVGISEGSPLSEATPIEAGDGRRFLETSVATINKQGVVGG